MTSDAAALCAGPRGRRVCLEFALADAYTRGAGAEELVEAVFYASYERDPGRGTSVVLFGPGVDGHAPPQVSPGEVARLMTDVPLTVTDDRTVLHGLAAAVDSARHWQEPDGRDVLAATPELEVPLHRVAAHLVASAQTEWWSTGVDRSAQWAVHFAETDPPAEVSAAVTLERWHAGQVEEEATAQRDRPTDPTAPWSGSWWSIPPARLLKTTRSLGARGPAGLWLVEDRMGWASATVASVRVPPGAIVYEVDGPDSWAELCRRYPLEVTASRRHDWYRSTGRAGRWAIPDWSSAARDLDAVHLTVSGYLSTAGRAIPVDGAVATVLAGWDPDQTFWLTEIEQDATSAAVWILADEMWRCSGPIDPLD